MAEFQEKFCERLFENIQSSGDQVDYSNLKDYLSEHQRSFLSAIEMEAWLEENFKGNPKVLENAEDIAEWLAELKYMVDDPV
jgi:hypothetical protein